LAGAAAALLPLLVHLLRRRPPRPVLFPALVLLVGPGERSARRRRIRELLLLATRMVLLALVAFTLAGPYLSRPISVPHAATRHQAAVILVDDTLSMRYRRGGRSLFDEAKSRARALLEALPPTAPVALLTVSDQGAQAPDLGVDRAHVSRAIDRLEATHLAASGADAISRALRALSGAPAGAPRSIYLLTDLTRTGLALAPGEVPKEVALQVIDLALGPLPNRAVVGLELVESASPGTPGSSTSSTASGAPGVSRRFRVTLRNSTDREEGMKVRLLVHGKELAKASLVVPPHSVSPVELSVPLASLPGSARFVEAALGSSDGLAEDDRRFLPLGRGPGTRVLLVDGDPRETRHADELFFLEAALGALSGQVPLRLRVVAAGDLDGADLEEEDLVVLANLAAPSREALEVLAAFVRRGGALLVALGDQVDPEAYNETLGVSLLPAKLRAIRAGGGAGPVGPPARVDPEHLAPAMRLALEDPESRRSLGAARVQRYGLLEQVTGEVLLRLDTGAPLLVAKAIGAGRVLLLTTTLDRDWSDLALRPAFLPLLRGILAYLTGQGAGGASQVLAGRPVTLRALPGERLVVMPPGGAPRLLEPAGPDGQVTFLRTDVPGPYQVFSSAPPRASAASPARPESGPVFLAACARDGTRARAPSPANLRASSIFQRPMVRSGAWGIAGLGMPPPLASVGIRPVRAVSVPPGLRERPLLAFAVVTDPAESDLRRLASAPGQPGLLGGPAAGAGPQSQARLRQDLVPWFALLCLLLMLTESILAARFSRWRPGGQAKS
jgi:hypothetical protein